jgi:hypothetical protein
MTDVAIRYQAQVSKIQTLIDGGMRLTLDLISPIPPDTIVALFDAKQPGIILECASVPIEKQSENNKFAIRERSKRKSERTPAERTNANQNP